MFLLDTSAASAFVLFRDLQAVVDDELHAFAGDDRGGHLLAVLERVPRLAGRATERLGLSATIGEPPHAPRLAAPRLVTAAPWVPADRPGVGLTASSTARVRYSP